MKTTEFLFGRGSARNSSKRRTLTFQALSATIGLTVILSGCSKTESNSTKTATSTPIAASTASNSPAERSTSAEPSLQSVAATPAAQGSLAPSPVASATTAAIASPSTSESRPFSGALLIGAFAASTPANLNQADAVVYALFSSKTGLACETVRKDFVDEFAAHRNIDAYVKRLTSDAKPIGSSTIELPTNLGPYDFNGKEFQIGANYGDGSRTFTFAPSPECSTPWYRMPDKSNVYGDVVAEVENAERLHLYPVPPDKAELLQKDVNRYAFSERLTFYPTAISRREDGRIGTVVHVTKVVFQERNAGAPSNAVPTVLMSVDVP